MIVTMLCTLAGVCLTWFITRHYYKKGNKPPVSHLVKGTEKMVFIVNPDGRLVQFAFKSKDDMLEFVYGLFDMVAKVAKSKPGPEYHFTLKSDGILRGNDCVTYFEYEIDKDSLIGMKEDLDKCMSKEKVKIMFTLLPDRKVNIEIKE